MSTLSNNYEIEKILSKAGKECGKNIINNYSLKLTTEVDKHYNYRTLYRMRKFYEIFSDEKIDTIGVKIKLESLYRVIKFKKYRRNYLLY